MNDDLDIPTRDQDTSRSTPGARTALVFGASGFIGRWLVKELLAQGIATTAAVRSSASGGRLAAWLEDHGAATHLLDTVQVDLAVDGLDLDPADVLRIRRPRRSGRRRRRTPRGCGRRRGGGVDRLGDR